MAAMAKFVVKTSKSGRNYFVMKARNGEVVATSELYESRQACLKGIESIKKNAGKAKIIEG